MCCSSVYQFNLIHLHWLLTLVYQHSIASRYESIEQMNSTAVPSQGKCVAKPPHISLSPSAWQHKLCFLFTLPWEICLVLSSSGSGFCRALHTDWCIASAKWQIIESNPLLHCRGGWEGGCYGGAGCGVNNKKKWSIIEARGPRRKHLLQR